MEIFGRQTANVGGKVRLASNQLAKMYEFMGAKLIRLVLMVGWRRWGLNISPEIAATGALVGWADAVFPIIAVGKTTAWIPDHRSLDLAHVVNQFLANAVYIGNLGVRPHPDAVVNHSAEVLCKMAV